MNASGRSSALCLNNGRQPHTALTWIRGRTYHHFAPGGIGVEYFEQIETNSTLLIWLPPREAEQAGPRKIQGNKENRHVIVEKTSFKIRWPRD